MKKSQKDIFALLKKDHRTVEGLFAQLEKTTERGKKKRESLYSELRTEITRHSHGEEKVVYPRLKEVETTEAIGYESTEEHGVVKQLLKKLDATPCDTKQWTALITVLKEVIEHHVEEEESEMFSKMKKAFGKDDLKLMGEEFAAAKEGLMERIVGLVAA